MAEKTVTGSSWGDFQTYMIYDTSSTATTYSVHFYEGGFKQNCTYSSYPFKGTISATGFNSITTTVGTKTRYEGKHAMFTTDRKFTWSRGTTSKTVAVRVTVQKTAENYSSGYARVEFTVPALAKYTVSYNANGGSGAPSAQTKYYGKTLTLSSTKPTRSGYTFVGWGTSSTDTTANWSAGGNYTTNASDTLYAIWKKTITLTYNANGGSGAPSASSATVYNATTSYSFSIKSTKPTRTGYNFKGWSKSSTASPSADLYVYGESITLSSSDTLYAIWETKMFTVTYNANGGTLPTSTSFINPQRKTYGVTLTLNTLKPSRADSIEEDLITKYTFKGWASSSTATTVDYKPGDDYTTNSNITLYAVWAENEIPVYDIIYKTQGGSSVAAQEKTEDQTITLRTTIPTRNGYTFNNKWNTKSDGTGTSYDPGASYSTNADLTLYAIWVPWTHNLNFNDNVLDEIISIPSDIFITTGTDVSIPDFIPTRSGYIFYAWNTKSDGSGDFYYPGNSYEHTQDGGIVTLYAIWVSTDIFIYNNGNCRAANFEEGAEYLSFINNGTIRAIEFIEGDKLNINETAFYITELKEDK